ncbi:MULTISPECIES: putative quinol monooxygenase [Aeromonas]|uniref:putative quinol monooxygenase n=1 Tax=Aeromonas TaxID=642 RepID=UPI000D381E75|nr:putative quinol monooxygenase [Aeromonas sp. HMWF014]PTT55735.1 antibiotic biosynthesis monooxygenase [Aeromonas sp. HMWF014]
MQKRIYCIAQYRPKKGCDERLIEALKSLEEGSRQDPGCIQYVTTQRVSSPFAEGSCLPITMNEIWASIDDFEFHCQTKPIKAFFEKECLSNDGSVETWDVSIFEGE